jgi:UDP-glucose 4-epimerase
MKKVFITGGAGFVGLHCAVSLLNNGYTPIIIDNFSNSYSNAIKKLKELSNKKFFFYKADLRNKKKIKLIFRKHQCHTVIHCAGFKSITESVKKPISYFDNNLGSTLNLLDCMQEYNVFNLIFSSSATVYNHNEPLPWKETSKTGNTKNPYASSKYVIEKILMDIAKFDKRWSIRVARYFNPVGNHSSGLIKENPKGIPNNLVPLIIKVVQKKIHRLKVFGKSYKTKDGTCVRDYIHVTDLADGHVAIIKKNNLSRKGFKVYNFGTGKGLSVLEVIKTFEKYVGIPIPFIYSKKRKGDIPAFYCCPKKALKELNWKAKLDLGQAMVDIKKII